MSIAIRLSSKGQIVIPKDVRQALGLIPGAALRLSREGRRIVIEAPEIERERISYDEFRRRMPRYDGPAIAIEDMTPDFAELWPDKD